MTLEQAVYRKFNERLTVYKEAIYNGTGSWEEYQRLVGYCQGMVDLMKDIDPFLKDPEEAGDADE